MESNDTCDYYYTKPTFKAPSHTFRRNVRATLAERDYKLKIKRPYRGSEIPVTLMDSILSNPVNDTIFSGFCPEIFNTYRDISLKKTNLFHNFINMIEEIAKNKKTTFDSSTNMVSTHYSVPCSGFISKHKPNFWDKSYCPESSNTSVKERFIVIGNNRYSNLYTYKKVHDSLVKLNIPDNDDSTMILDNEQQYLPTKTDVKGSYIQMSYHHDINISSIIISPEKMIFDKIHGDNIECVKGCAKDKHTINVLRFNPGYISRFALHYRSSKTNGKWINHGIYQGCNDMFTRVKVSFDSIDVNQLRIVPIDYVNKFDKVKIHAVGQSDMANAPLDDIMVEYIVRTPREGKYAQNKIRDYVHWTNKEYREYQFRLKDRQKPRFVNGYVDNKNYQNNDYEIDYDFV